jgi:hypothetical protein
VLQTLTFPYGSPFIPLPLLLQVLSSKKTPKRGEKLVSHALIVVVFSLPAGTTVRTLTTSSFHIFPLPFPFQPHIDVIPIVAWAM